MFFSRDTRIPDAEAETRMQPGVENLYGFLGNGESLQQRLQTDSELMRKLGLEFEALAQRCEEVFAADSDSWNSHPVLKIQHIAGMKCPWNDFLSSNPLINTPAVRELVIVHRDKIDQASDIIRRHSEAGQVSLASIGDLVRQDCAMVLSDLHPHLLREHRFLEGLATPYRIHPEKVEEYLGPLA